MFYLSNFARTKGARDKKPRERRDILLKAARDGLITTGLVIPSILVTRKLIAKPLMTRRFKARKELLNLENKKGNKSLENEFANTFLKNKNLENLRQEYLQDKIKNYKTRKDVKDLILPSLSLGSGASILSFQGRVTKKGMKNRSKRKKK